MKSCSKCGDEKPLGDFYKSPSTSDGRFGSCKACVLAARRVRYERDGELLRQRVRAYQARGCVPDPVRQERLADPERGRKRNRAAHLKKYGLTPATFDALFDAQDGRCAICRLDEPGRYWTVDHDHTTGVVRGILCWHCNVALGHFRDDVSSLIAAADYLLRVRETVEEVA